MDNIRIAILDSNDNIITFMDNAAPDALHYCDDELHEYLSGSAYTFEFTGSARHDDSQYLMVGNKLSFIYRDKGYYLNIVQTERDEFDVTVTAYGALLELLNEQVGAYSASSAMSFEEYIAAFNFESGIITIGINEVSDKSITNEWTGTATVLSRLYSLATVFSAEIEFVTELNEDYTISQLTMNVYQEHDEDNDIQGMGVDRTNEIVLRYGLDIEGITKKSDITELYTAIRPTGTDGLTISSLDKYEYDDDGAILYQSPSGNRNIYAVQAMEQYPSNVMDGISDRYICKIWEYDTDNVNTLYGQALAQLKKYCVPQVEYEVDGYFDTGIGDTVRIDDQEFNPALYLTARVTEQVRSFTDPAKNKTTFSNFRELESEIDDSLITQMNALIEANKTYTCVITTDNGIVFKNNEGTTTLTAIVLDSVTNIASDFTITWYKDGEELATGESITISATDISGKSVYRFEATDSNGTLRGFYEVTVSNTSDGVGLADMVARFGVSDSYETGADEYSDNYIVVDETEYLWTKYTVVLTDGSTIETTPYCLTDGSARIIAKEIRADYVKATELEAEVATFGYLKADELEAAVGKFGFLYADELEAKIATFGYLTVGELDAAAAEIVRLTTSELYAAIADIGYLTAGTVIADEVTALSLVADVANINTVLAGSIGTGTLQAIHITSENTVIDEAVIESAAIVSLAADKITSGTIYTSFVTIRTGDDGTGLYIADDLIAMYDDNGTMRLQAGSTDDITGEKNGYNFVIWDEEETVLFNATGITASGIPAETIVNEHVADNAAIDGKKLNITSVISYIESDGSLTVDYANVIIDNTTMSAWYVSVNDSMDGLTNTMSTLQSEFTVVQGMITSKVWETDITTAVDALSIGGRNYLLNTKELSYEYGKTQYNTTYWELTEDENGYGVLAPTDARVGVAASGIYLFSDIEPFPDSDTSNHVWAGKETRLSFDMKCPYADKVYANTSGYAINVRYAIYGSNNKTSWSLMRYLDAYLGNPDTQGNFEYSNTDWFRWVYKRTWPENMDSGWTGINSGSYTYYRYAINLIFPASNTQTDTAYFRKPKLEIGTVATDWSPAPEDVDENLTIITDKYSSVTQTIDGITDEIGEITEMVDSNYKTLESKITTVEETANGVVTTVKDLTTTVNNWDVGGRNYLRNTKDLTYQTSQTVYSLTYWTRTVDNDGYGVLSVTGNGGWLNVDLYTSIDATGNPWEGKEIVFSADVKADELKTSPAKYALSVEIFGSNDGTSWVRGYYTYTLLSSSSFYTFNRDDWADGEWVKLTAKFTMPALSSMTTSTGADYTYHVYGMAVYSTATNTDTELSFRKPKLELGTVATDWTPAPEDVDSAITVTSDKYATLSVTVDGLIGTVGDLESTVTDYYSEIDNRITTVAETADGVVTTVESLYAIVYNWDVGGRNYLLNTKALTVETAKTYYSSTYWSLAEDDDGYGVITSNTSYSAVARSLRFYTDINPFEDGDTSEHKWSGESVIFSFDFKCPYASAIPATSSSVYDTYVSISIYGSNDLTTWVRYRYTDMRIGDTAYRISDDCSDTDWFRLKMKRNMPALASLSSATTSTYKYYRYAAEFRLSGTNTQTDAVSIRKPKLELGTVATDWTPAPEDVDYATSIISDKYATLETTVNGIYGEVGDLQTVVSDNYTYFYNHVTAVEETADGLSATVSSFEATLNNNILADSTFDGYTTFGSSYSWYRTDSTYIKVSEYDDDVCVCFTRGGSAYYLRQAISLDAGTYVVRAKIACGDGCAPAVRARLGSTYAYLHDTGELSSEWKTYSTTITITSAATYYYLYVYAAYGSTSAAETECYVTNLAVYDDYSIDYTQSQIQVLSDSISMSVTGSLGDTASIVISANGSEVSKTTLDLSGVRSAFADDTTAVEISAGTVTFKSGTLVVDANNFKLASDGSAALYGSVYFNNSLYMHFDKADVSAGYYNIIKTEVLDNSYSGIYFGMIDDSIWYGETFLYLGTDGDFRLRSGGKDIFYADIDGGTNAAFIFSRDLGQQPKLMDYGYGVFGYNTNNKFYLTWDKSTPALGITVDSTAMYLTYTTSDERLKQNFADIDDALIESVGNAPLLSFNMDCEAYDDSVVYVGTTAQLLIEQMAANGLTTDDARKLLAQQTVYTDSDDKYWMIDYEQFLLLRIAYDEKRIAALESQLAAYA